MVIQELLKQFVSNKSNILLVYPKLGIEIENIVELQNIGVIELLEHFKLAHDIFESRIFDGQQTNLEQIIIERIVAELVDDFARGHCAVSRVTAYFLGLVAVKVFRFVVRLFAIVLNLVINTLII